MQNELPNQDRAGVTPPGLVSGSPPQIPDYELIRCVGRGSYGEVWLARSVIGTCHAVKLVYRKNFQHERPYEREFSGIKKFEPISRSHECLMNILHVGRNDPDGYFYYVMELADDADSGQVVDLRTYAPKTLGADVAVHRKFSVDECLRLALSLTSAVGHLHKHGLIHRDIKPSNIIFVHGIPKLADIGLVTDVGTDSIPGGTLGYLAPEGIPSPQADLYSLGKVLYEISTGKDRQQFPDVPTFWEDDGDRERFAEFNEVVIKACERDPKKRYQSAAELHSDLVFLQAGKSVRRLRTLERQVALLKRFGLLALIVGALVCAGYYQVARDKRQNTKRLVASYVATAKGSLDRGDLFGALPWLAEALQLDSDDETASQQHRLHIGAVLRQCPRIVRMWFEEESLNHVEFSPDGRRVVAAGRNSLVAVWDIEQDKEVFRLQGHTSEVKCAAFSRDGRYIVTASIDKTARLWDAQTGQEMPSRSPLVHTQEVLHAQFSPDGQWVVTTCSDRVARLWDAASGGLVRAFPENRRIVRCAAFSPDGRWLVTASHDTGEASAAQVWDVATGEAVSKPLPHAHWIYYVAFSPDGRYVATASYDRTVKVWEPLNGVAPLTLEHAAPVRTVEFSPDGRYLVTACWDFTVWVWDAATGKLAAPPLRQTGNPLHAAFDPEGRRIVTADMRGVICLYDLSRNNWLPSTTHAAVSGNGSRFALMRSNEVQVCDAATQAALLSPIALSDPLKQVHFTRDGRRLLTVTTSGENSGAGQCEARLWNAQTGQALFSPFVCSGSIKSFSLDETGQRALALRGNTVEVRDTSTGRVLTELPHAANVLEAIFSPGGKEIVTASSTNAQLWASDSGQLLYLWPHAGTVTHVEISPQGNRVVTTCSDGTLNEHEAQVWDTITGRKVGSPLRHRDGVLYAAFSPDGRRVVTASEDRIAQVWETETGRRLGPRLVHKDEVFFAAFSPDGRWVVTCCRDNTVRVWDATTGVPITPLLRHPDPPPTQARFVPNSRYLVTLRPGAAQTWWWELAEDLRPVEDLMRLTRLLASNQSDQTGSALPLTKAALRELWEQLRRQYPADFASSPADIALWRQLEAAASEKAGQWFAALFHLDRLIESNPTDPSLRERQARARSKLAAQ